MKNSEIKSFTYSFKKKREDLIELEKIVKIILSKKIILKEHDFDFSYKGNSVI